MSDCPKCWDTPCTCGYYWHDASRKYRIDQASKILGVSIEVIEGKIGEFILEKHPKLESK